MMRPTALAAWRNAGIPTALAVWSTSKLVPQTIRATFATLAHADVTAARRLWTTLKFAAMPVGAHLDADLVVSTNCRWVLVAIGEAATLAAWGSTCVPTAKPTILAWEVIAKGVRAAVVVVGSTDVAAALRPLGALELFASAICAGARAELQPRGGILNFPLVALRNG